MLGRLITVDTQFQDVSALQDLLEVKLGTVQAGYVIRAKIIQKNKEAAADAQVIAVNLKRASGSFTSGSGGGSPLVILNSNSLAHGFAVAERNNTTQAVVNTGVLDVVEPGAFNVLSGEWEFCPPPELMEKGKIGPSESAILSVDEAPTGTISMRAILDILITHG